MLRRYWYLLIFVALALGSAFGLQQFFAHKSTTSFFKDDANSIWQVCSGPDLGYSFNYPNNFQVWEYRPGAYLPVPCTEIKDASQLVLAMALNKDPLKNRIDFNWIDSNALSSPPHSVNDFLAQSPDILKNGEILKRAPLGGEESIWIQRQDGGIEVFAVHNSNVIDISDYTVDNAIFNQILTTFQFRQ